MTGMRSTITTNGFYTPGDNVCPLYSCLLLGYRDVNPGTLCDPVCFRIEVCVHAVQTLKALSSNGMANDILIRGEGADGNKYKHRLNEVGMMNICNTITMWIFTLVCND